MDAKQTRRRYRVGFDTTSSVIMPGPLARLEIVCEALHAATILLLRQRRVRGFSLQMILTHDLVAAVELLRPSSEERSSVFTADRLSGTVVAKTFFPVADGEPYVVVMDDALWVGDDGEGLALGIETIAHELGHCAIERVRRMTAPSPPEDALTVGELAAREIVREALDEYRADLFADLFLQAMGDVSDGGAPTPLRLQHLSGRRFSESLGEVLSGEVYPGWPDRVQAYRDHEVPLEDMFRGLVLSGWGVFVAIAHAGSVARTADDTDPLDGEFASHPAVSLYLWGPWYCLREIANAFRPVCSASAQAKLEARALTEGVAAVLEMWSRLGLSFTLDGDGGTCIGVTEPLRAE